METAVSAARFRYDRPAMTAKNDFKQRTLSGLGWSLMGQAGRQTLALALGMILARLLSPEEFGLIGMVLVFSGFAALVSEFGFGAAIIQRAPLRNDHLDSVFWANLLLGVSLCAIFILAAPVIAAFYSEPRVVAIARLVSVIFIVESFPTVPRAILIKDLDFRRVVTVEACAAAVSGLSAIGAASAGFGVWSLVIQLLTYSATNATLLWVVSGWRPHLRFRFQAIRELLGFGASLLGSRCLNYGRRNIDSLLVGRILGIEALGFYNLSYRIMLVPVWNVTQVLYRVLFSSFSQIQDQHDRIGRLFVRSVGAGALVAFPLMAGLLVTARPFVLTILGSQWEPMVPILEILCIASFSEMLYPLTGNLFLSQGRADLQFKIGLLTRFVTIAGIVAGLRWGILGVATGFTVASLLNLIPAYRSSTRLVNLSIGRIVREVAPIICCTAGMAGVVALLGRSLSSAWAPWLELLIEVSVGVGTYALLIHLFKPQAYRDGRTLLDEWLRGEWQLRTPSATDLVE